MDEPERAALLRHVLSLGGADTAVAVPVEQFLDGNDDDGCIDSGSDLEVEANDIPAGTTFSMPGAPPVLVGMAYVGVWWD